MKLNKKFLYKYLNAYSPVAQESEGQGIWMDYITPYCDEVHVDGYGTAYGILKGKQSKTPNKRVIIEAHCDEIAWIVTHIEPNGMLRVKPHGGSDTIIAPSMDVVVHTHNGKKVNGVFGQTAIHTRKGAYNGEPSPTPSQLWVDLGLATKEEVLDAHVEVGCIVTFNTTLKELGEYYVGRSLDNKVGGFVIAEVLRKLHKTATKLPYDLYIVNSVQEEVGLFGAKRIAKKLQGDVCINIDATHNTNSPNMDKAKEGAAEGGLGVCFEHTAQNHRGILNKLKEVASNNNIPYQNTVGSYGNDTLGFFLENTNVSIISFPLKYMHTTVEMVHKKDIKHCIELYFKFLTNLTKGDINEFGDKML